MIWTVEELERAGKESEFVPMSSESGRKESSSSKDWPK